MLVHIVSFSLAQFNVKLLSIFCTLVIKHINDDDDDFCRVWRVGSKIQETYFL